MTRSKLERLSRYLREERLPFEAFSCDLISKKASHVILPKSVKEVFREKFSDWDQASEIDSYEYKAEAGDTIEAVIKSEYSRQLKQLSGIEDLVGSLKQIIYHLNPSLDQTTSALLEGERLLIPLYQKVFWGSDLGSAVYILKIIGKTEGQHMYYVGETNNIFRRFSQHKFLFHHNGTAYADYKGIVDESIASDAMSYGSNGAKIISSFNEDTDKTGGIKEVRLEYVELLGGDKDWADARMARLKRERELFLEMVAMHGLGKVRGANWCKYKYKWRSDQNVWSVKGYDEIVKNMLSNYIETNDIKWGSLNVQEKYFLLAEIRLKEERELPLGREADEALIKMVSSTILDSDDIYLEGARVSNRRKNKGKRTNPILFRNPDRQNLMSKVLGWRKALFVAQEKYQQDLAQTDHKKGVDRILIYNVEESPLGTELVNWARSPIPSFIGDLVGLCEAVLRTSTESSSIIKLGTPVEWSVEELLQMLDIKKKTIIKNHGAKGAKYAAWIDSQLEGHRDTIALLQNGPHPGLARERIRDIVSLEYVTAAPGAGAASPFRVAVSINGPSSRSRKNRRRGSKNRNKVSRQLREMNTTISEHRTAIYSDMIKADTMLHLIKTFFEGFSTRISETQSSLTGLPIMPDFPSLMQMNPHLVGAQYEKSKVKAISIINNALSSDNTSNKYPYVSAEYSRDVFEIFSGHYENIFHDEPGSDWDPNATDPVPTEISSNYSEYSFTQFFKQVWGDMIKLNDILKPFAPPPGIDVIHDNRPNYNLSDMPEEVAEIVDGYLKVNAHVGNEEIISRLGMLYLELNVAFFITISDDDKNTFVQTYRSKIGAPFSSEIKELVGIKTKRMRELEVLREAEKSGRTNSTFFDEHSVVSVKNYEDDDLSLPDYKYIGVINQVFESVPHVITMMKRAVQIYSRSFRGKQMSNRELAQSVGGSWTKETLEESLKDTPIRVVPGSYLDLAIRSPRAGKAAPIFRAIRKHNKIRPEEPWPAEIMIDINSFTKFVKLRFSMAFKEYLNIDFVKKHRYREAKLGEKHATEADISAIWSIIEEYSEDPDSKPEDWLELRQKVMENTSLSLSSPMARDIFDWYQNVYELGKDITSIMFRDIFVISERARGSRGNLPVKVEDPMIDLVNQVDTNVEEEVSKVLYKLNKARSEESSSEEFSIRWFGVYNKLYKNIKGTTLGPNHRGFINSLLKGDLFSRHTIVGKAGELESKLNSWADDAILTKVFGIEESLLSAMLCLKRVRELNDYLNSLDGITAGDKKIHMRIPNTVVFLARNPEAAVSALINELIVWNVRNPASAVCEILDKIITLIDNGHITEETISAYFCQIHSKEFVGRLSSVRSAATRLISDSTCNIEEHDVDPADPDNDIDIDQGPGMQKDANRHLRLERLVKHSLRYG